MCDNANIELARRLLAAFQGGDDSALADLIHTDHRDHAAPDRSPGPEGVRESLHHVRDTFAGLRIVPEDFIASGDRVVARVHLTATQAVATEQIHIWRVADRRLVEHWMVPAQGAQR